MAGADVGELVDADARGRAQLAYEFELARWQLVIEGVLQDRSLTPDQRAAALAALRVRQKIEAKAARRRIIEEARQTVRARRRNQRVQESPKPK